MRKYTEEEFKINRSQAMLSENNRYIYETAAENSRKMLDIITGVLNGTQTIRDGCKKYGLSYRSFFYYIRKLAQIDPKAKQMPKNVVFEITPTEQIYAAVFGVKSETVGDIMPDDADEAVEIVLSMLKEKQATVVRMYSEGYKLKEIADKLGVTGERIRQIRNEAYSRMRKNYLRRIMEYGAGVADEARKQAEEEHRTKIADYKKTLETGVENQEQDSVNDDSDKTLEEIGLCAFTRKKCINNGIKSASDFQSISYKDLQEAPGIGEKTLVDIMKALHKHNIHLKNEPPFDENE